MFGNMFGICKLDKKKQHSTNSYLELSMKMFNLRAQGKHTISIIQFLDKHYITLRSANTVLLRLPAPEVNK